ncbi:MAG: hypothetical protein KGZ86_03935 [Candidatus Latescibacteria bacterium]|nr:hypothetical protein [Candidatus Latescibacterota bacterium]
MAILKTFRRKERINQIIFSGLLILSVLLFLLIIVIGLLINRLLLLILVPLIGLVIYKGNFFKSIIATARDVEKGFPEVNNKLIPAVELFSRCQTVDTIKSSTSDKKENYSDQLIKAAVEQASQKIKELPVDKIINFRKNKIIASICLTLLLIFISIKIFSPDHFSFGWNLIFSKPESLITLDIQPGSIYVNKDSEVNLSYSVIAPIRGLQSKFYAKDKKYKQPGLSFTTNITADRDFTYYVTINSRIGLPVWKSSEYYIKLHKPIEITEMVFTYHYPSYTKLPSVTSYSNEIRAVTGTRVEFSGSASMRLDYAVRMGKKDTDRLVVKDNQFKGSFMITQADSFEFVLSAENHRQGKSRTYYIKPIADETPFVKMLLPGRDIELPVSMQVVIAMYAIDDFGLSRFDLHYTRSISSETSSVRLKTVSNKSEDTLFYLWDLNRMNLLPGEMINYYGVVYDNDAVSGYKRGRTETYSIRFPTLAEIYNKTTETSQSTMNRLEPISETQEQLAKELDKISEHIKRYREMNWEEQSKLDLLLNRQEELMSDISALQQEINNVMSDLHSGLMLDQETMEQLEKISNILNQILPEEMKQNLEKLRQAMLEKNPDMAKALEDFKLSSEEMKQALQRALELLKKIQQEEQIMNLARKAEEIYKQQSQLNARIENEKLEQLVAPQNQIGNEIKALDNDIKTAQQSIEDSLVQAELAKIRQELEQMELDNQVNNVSNNLSNSNRSASKKSASDLLKDLAALKDRLQNLADMFKQNQQQKLTDKLIQVALDLNNISIEQEKIRPSQNREQLSALVTRQQRMSEATTLVAETLAKWSEQSLFISPKWTQEVTRAVISMENAARLLEEAVHMNIDLRAVHNLQKDASYSLDIVTLQILRQILLGQQSGGKQGGLESLLQALSQMTADQMALGQGMGSIPIPMPGGLSAEQMAQLGRLMSMQSQLRAQLEQLMQEINAGQYGEMPGMTGSMQGALEEMKQIEKDLSELNVTRQTIERQEKVIDRLLDAQRSIRQKDYSEKREREIGKDYPDRPVIILDRNLGEINKQLREELLRSMREGYPKEYEQMIKNYFESLLQE